MSDVDQQADVVVGILVGEVSRATTWRQVVACADAIFHVRLLHKEMADEAQRAQTADRRSAGEQAS